MPAVSQRCADHSGVSSSSGHEGGGGGVAIIAYGSVNGGITFSAATNCPGGALGVNGGGGATNGTAGSNGQVFAILLGGF